MGINIYKSCDGYNRRGRRGSQNFFYFSLRSSANSVVSNKLISTHVSCFNLPPPLRYPTVIEKQNAYPSQTLQQTARGGYAMRAAASGVDGCCRWWMWLLKYII